jgi:hypothetical protein
MHNANLQTGATIQVAPARSKRVAVPFFVLVRLRGPFLRPAVNGK